ncbi:MAG: hypothetical protein ACE5D8_07675 [Fidelibacterota bacterium]
MSVGTSRIGILNGNEESEYGIDFSDIQFYNITIGINALTVPENNDGRRNYWYLEGQYGKIGLFPHAFPFSGVTAGIWRYKNKPFYPKIGLFSGFIGWGELDIRILENKKWKFDTGASVSFPFSYETIKETIRH